MALHMRERDHHEQAADMETGRGRIESDVPRQSLAREDVAKPFRGAVDEAAPLKLAIEVHEPLLYNPAMVLSRRALLKGALATTVGAATGTAAYGIGYERHNIGVTQAALSVSGLPPALDGLRIALLTDVHHSRMVPADDVAEAVQLTLAQRPDLIVLGGDYVTFGDRAFVGPVAELLSPLRAPHGVFAILGNHDDDRDLPAALTKQHIQVLKDARTRLTIKGEPLELAGLRFWTRQLSDVARVLRKATDTVLLLAHDPRRLNQAAELNVPAVLSGHTHGGQVVLPGVGALARQRFPILEGVGRLENTSIFVSRGLGTIYVPIRLNCPPEVAMVTLKRRSQI